MMKVTANSNIEEIWEAYERGEEVEWFEPTNYSEAMKLFSLGNELDNLSKALINKAEPIISIWEESSKIAKGIK